MFAVTDNDSWEEWSGKIYPADPAYYNFTIKGASKEKYKIVDDVMTTYQFINVDGEWYYDVNADGEIDEAEMDKRDIESSYYYPEIIFLGDGRVAMQMEITLNYTEEDDVNTYYGWPAKGSLAINIFYTILSELIFVIFELFPLIFLVFSPFPSSIFMVCFLFWYQRSITPIQLDKQLYRQPSRRSSSICAPALAPWVYAASYPYSDASRCASIS